MKTVANTTDSDLWELGGADLVRLYPDRGQIADSNYFKGVLQLRGTAVGGWRWLTRLGRGSQPYLTTLSSDGDGIRVVVLSESFAIYVPWQEATISAERSWPATELRIAPIPIAGFELQIQLDDDAADELLRDAITPLPRRQPPRRLALWLTESWGPWAVLAITLCAGIIVSFAIGGK